MPNEDGKLQDKILGVPRKLGKQEARRHGKHMYGKILVVAKHFNSWKFYKWLTNQSGRNARSTVIEFF